MISTLSDRITAQEYRLKALEGVEDDAPEEYPAWVSWDGISKDYQRGSVVSHIGQLWESVYDGQNVWEPGTAGTEGMWKRI